MEPDRGHTEEVLGLLWDWLAKAPAAYLGTLDEGEKPFVTPVGFVAFQENGVGFILLFLSDLARHTRNLRSHPQVSLLVVEPHPSPDPSSSRRATLMGRAEALPGGSTEFQASQDLYFKKYPKSRRFAAFSDFHFFRIRLEEIHWFGGFGTAARFVFQEGVWRKAS